MMMWQKVLGLVVALATVAAVARKVMSSRHDTTTDSEGVLAF